MSYLNHAVPEHRQSAQGVLQVIQHALGKGSGAIFGGIMINYIGQLTELSALCLPLYIALLCFIACECLCGFQISWISSLVMYDAN